MNVLGFTFSAIRNSNTAQCLRHVDIADLPDSIATTADKDKWVESNDTLIFVVGRNKEAALYIYSGTCNCALLFVFYTLTNSLR